MPPPAAAADNKTDKDRDRLAELQHYYCYYYNYYNDIKHEQSLIHIGPAIGSRYTLFYACMYLLQ